MMHVPNQYRIRSGRLGSDDTLGNNGAFRVPLGSRYVFVIATETDGWEHVSVSGKATPSWDDMCAIKALFWDAEDVVMQLHPRASEYVNCHPHCLHLWRPVGIVIPTPPAWMVGPVRR